MIRPPDLAITGTTLRYMSIDSAEAVRRLIHLAFRDAHTAIKMTHDCYPRVLKENKQVHFKLRCRYFIEMVRKNAELREEAEVRTKRNGVSTDSSSQKMEIDQNMEKA